MKLSKSIQELDSIAEALLKSVDKDQDDLTPDDIADAPTKSSKEEPSKDPDEDSKEEDSKNNTAEGEDTPDKEEEDTVKKSMKKSATKKSMKKSDEEDSEDEEADLDEDEDEDEEDDDIDSLEKSLKTQFVGTSGIGGDSEFLEAIVNVLSKSLAENVYNLQALSGNTQASTDVLAKSLQANLGLNKSLVATVNELKQENTELKKSIAEGFSSLQDSLDSALSQPSRMRKSVTNVAVNDKDFTHSLSGQYSPSESLSKAQVMGVLNSELFSGNPMITPQDVISYESGAPLREEVRNLVINKCK